ncbi:uncharacterized protein LOC135494587 isoform X2 [Lineus longissimus]
MAMRGRWCRTRIGNIFLVIIVVAMVLFVLNYFYGLDTFFRKDRQPIDTEMGPIRSHRKHHRTHRKHGRTSKSDVQVCPRPKLDLQHDIIKGAFHQVPPLRCLKKPLFYIEDGVIHVNQSEVRGKKIEKCVYRAIERMVDNMYVYSKPHTRYQEPFALKIKHDFFRVQCFVSDMNPGRQLKQVQDDGVAANLAMNSDTRQVRAGNLRRQAKLDANAGLRRQADVTGNRQVRPGDTHRQAGLDGAHRQDRVAAFDRQDELDGVGGQAARLDSGHKQTGVGTGSRGNLNPVHQVQSGRVQPGVGFRSENTGDIGRRGKTHPDSLNNLYEDKGEENTNNVGMVGEKNEAFRGGVVENGVVRGRLNGGAESVAVHRGESVRPVEHKVKGNGNIGEQPRGGNVQDSVLRDGVKQDQGRVEGSLKQGGPNVRRVENGLLSPVARDENRLDSAGRRGMEQRVRPMLANSLQNQQNPVQNGQNPPAKKKQGDPTANVMKAPVKTKINTRLPNDLNRPVNLNQPVNPAQKAPAKPVRGMDNVDPKPTQTTTPPADDDSEEMYDNEPDYDQFFAHVHPRRDVFERIDELRPKDGTKQMNVLMVIIDSLSHMSWKRKLPQTYRFLKNSLGSTVLDGYNIVGDGTTPNIVALLTGKQIEELPETRRSQYDSTYVDRYPLLWLDYEKKGYATLFAEDEPTMGTFNLRLNGFEKTPTDHYMRPFWQAIWESTLNKNSPRFCLGEKPKHQYMLDYGRDFFVKYHNVSKFGIIFHGELTHADNNPGEHIDTDLVKFLVALKSGHYLDNTLLVVMSDHGARYSTVRHTIQGKLEERLPLMSLAFPKWFQKKYPASIKNLKDNVGKLTTPFDVYETLKDVLDSKRLETRPKYNDRGISVLKSIPRNRTCASAGIALHWCTCLRYEEVDTKDKLTRKAAAAVVTHMNKMTTNHRDVCHELTLQNLFDAKMIIPNEQLLKYYNSFDNDHRIANFTKKAQVDSAHFQITFDTAPSNALYEGTVLVDFKKGSYKVTSEISRINPYNKESHCVIDKYPELRKFCYCKKSFSSSPASRTYV